MTPRMRQILDEATTTVHGGIPDSYHITPKAYTRLSDFKSLHRMVGLLRDRNGRVYHGDMSYHTGQVWTQQHHGCRYDCWLCCGGGNIEVTAATYLIMITICRAKDPALSSRDASDEPGVGCGSLLHSSQCLCRRFRSRRG